MKNINELLMFLKQDSNVLFNDVIWHKRTMEIYMNEKLIELLLDHLNTFPKELVSVIGIAEKMEVGKVSVYDHFGYVDIGLFKIILDMDQKAYSIHKLY